MENKTKDSLASELLHELKASSKRWFILFIITLFMLFATNSMWLYAWNLPPEETSESYDIDSEEKELFKKHLTTLQNIPKVNII